MTFLAGGLVAAGALCVVSSLVTDVLRHWSPDDHLTWQVPPHVTRAMRFVGLVLVVGGLFVLTWDATGG